MNSHIHVYDSITKAGKTNKSLTINDWFTLIKNPLDHFQTIQEIRTEYRNNGKSEKYSLLKKTKLPCVTFNQLFLEGKRRHSYAFAPTGYLYIDVDNIDVNKLKNQLFQHPNITAVWKSLSGNGIGAIVRINGVNNANYKLAFNRLKEEFDFLDENTFKLSQPTILSFDEEILIKDAEPLLWDYSVTQIDDIIIPITERTDKELVKLRTEYTLDYYQSDCDYFPEGKPYYQAYWPFTSKGKLKTVSQGQRNNILSSFIHNLVCLNPTADIGLIVMYANSFNKKYCSPSLPYSEVNLIVASKRESLKQETLQPLNVTMKKYWVKPTVANKVKAFQKARKNKSVENTEENIIKTIEKLKDEKIKVTQNNVAKESKLSIATIKRYWKKVSSTIN
jgi:hypothetical protein